MWIGAVEAKTLEGSTNNRAANPHEGVGCGCILQSQREVSKINSGTCVTLFYANGTWVPKVCSIFGRSRRHF